MTGSTTRESQRDLGRSAPVRWSMSPTKQAVWAANERKYDLPDNKIRQITVDGTPAFAAYVPGQGTIVSTAGRWFGTLLPAAHQVKYWRCSWVQLTKSGYEADTVASCR